MDATFLILARLGSKRIPNKNIADFHGTPIINHPIFQLIGLGDIIVSTDDPVSIYNALIQPHKEIVSIVKRSDENSSDIATTLDVIKEILPLIKTKYFCAVYPTSVYFRARQIANAINQLETSMGVCLYSRSVHSSNTNNDAAQFYVINTGYVDIMENILLDKFSFGVELFSKNNSSPYLKLITDINTEEDLAFARETYPTYSAFADSPIGFD